MYGCMIHVVKYSTHIYMCSIEYDQMIDYLFRRTTSEVGYDIEGVLKMSPISVLGPHCVTHLSSSAYWDPTSRGWETLLYRYMYQSLYGSILCFSISCPNYPCTKWPNDLKAARRGTYVPVAQVRNPSQSNASNYVQWNACPIGDYMSDESQIIC